MAFYKCPDCPTYFTTKWSMLKGHFSLKHRDTRADLVTEDKKEDAFTPFEISEEDYVRLTGKGKPPLIVETGLEKDDDKTQGTGSPEKTPVSGTPRVEPAAVAPEIISQYTGDPVGRLHQVMVVNQVEPKLIERITNIMALSPRYWTNYRELEELLVSHIGPIKRGLCQTIVSQYADGVQLPREERSMYPYNTAPGASNFNQPFGYQNPYGPPPVTYGPPAPNPEVATLKAEIDRLRDERHQDNEKRLLDRIAELEKKNEGGGVVAQLQAQIEELKKQLSGAGQQATMILYDDKGNPMQVPYDRSFMEALRRKQEVETESARTEQMIKLMTLNGGSNDRFDQMMAEMKADREAANKRIEELSKAITGPADQTP